jgi:lipooligosaccharide transport system ATP-binding protein
MIRARGLRKSFGSFEAVKGIDVEVRPGETFGFLGPNGAGKSSTMRMIAAVSPVTGGELRILGEDPAAGGPAIRSRLGVCPQEDTLDPELTVFDNLYVYGRFFGLPRAEVRRRTEELLDFVQLTERARSKVDDLSGGMKRRVTIARALINRPDILMLDEPTTGLDPVGRRIVRDLLLELKRRGVAVLLNSHLLSEIERVCDRVAILVAGRIVAQGSPADLAQAHGVEIDVDGGTRAFPDATREQVPDIVAGLVAAGERVYGVRVLSSTLEDTYLEAVAGS